VAGKVSTLGINIPSVEAGAIWLDDRISNCAFGVVVLIPTWAKSEVENKTKK
jgi:hypothetical protein